MIAKLIDGKLYTLGTGELQQFHIDNGYDLYDNNYFQVREDGSFYELYNVDGTPDLDAIDALKNQEQELIAQQEAKLAREQLMLTGDTYSLNGIDYQISFTKNDGDGLVQVKSAFELGLANTVIVFENGTKLPITASEFTSFASWFVAKRNEFFV